MIRNRIKMLKREKQKDISKKYKSFEIKIYKAEEALLKITRKLKSYKERKNVKKKRAPPGNKND